MLLIVVIVGVVVCVFLGHFAFSYHKQEKTVRSKGGITAMFSEVIKGLLEYRSARVVQQSNSFIGISGVFYDPITSRECGNWGFKLQISFQLLVVQYRAYVDLGGGEHIKQNWDFPITLSQSEIVNILKKKADETNVYGIFNKSGSSYVYDMNELEVIFFVEDTLEFVDNGYFTSESGNYYTLDGEEIYKR